jgi:DNA mismatch repair protein MutS2
VGERLRDARREVETVISELKRRAAELTSRAARQASHDASALSTGETGHVRAAAISALDHIAARLQGAEDEAGSEPHAGADEAAKAGDDRPAKAGDRVTVRPLGLEGLVVLVAGSEAEVDVQGKRLRVPVGNLQVLAPRAAPPAGGRVHVQVTSRDQASSDLNVIGCTVDEALTRAEKFLDDTLLTDQRTVRLIHGYGTGQLRRALAAFLQDHPLVARFESAPPEHGGAGVTVVELKE